MSGSDVNVILMKFAMRVCWHIPFVHVCLYSVGLGLQVGYKMCVDFTVNLKF